MYTYSKQSCRAGAGAERRRVAMARREEEAAELEAGPRLRRTSRRAMVWGLSWAKTAVRVSSEAAAAAASIPAGCGVVEGGSSVGAATGGELRRGRFRPPLGERRRGF
jgi:hypothetical protein